jgi:hypothetical protein
VSVHYKINIDDLPFVLSGVTCQAIACHDTVTIWKLHFAIFLLHHCESPPLPLIVDQSTKKSKLKIFSVSIHNMNHHILVWGSRKVLFGKNRCGLPAVLRTACMSAVLKDLEQERRRFNWDDMHLRCEIEPHIKMQPFFCCQFCCCFYFGVWQQSCWGLFLFWICSEVDKRVPFFVNPKFFFWLLFFSLEFVSKFVMGLTFQIFSKRVNGPIFLSPKFLFCCHFFSEFVN